MHPILDPALAIFGKAVPSTIKWHRERTEHLDIFLFSPITQWCSYFRYSVYWWKGSVRF